MARLLLLGTALVETLLFSGCLLGWNSLSPILTEEGVLTTDCQPDPELPRPQINDSVYPGMGSSPSPPSVGLDTDRSSSVRTRPTLCTSQQQSLHLGFTVGSVFLGCTFLPLQLLTGYAELRTLRQIGSALVSVALLMLAYSCTNPRSLSLFLPFALVGLGVGGSCVLFTSLMLPGILKKEGPLYTSLVIASFTASATVFTMLKVIYSYGVPFVPVILGFGALSCLMFLNTFFSWDSGKSGDGKETFSISLRLHCYDVLKKKKEEEKVWCQQSLKHKFQESLRDKERILSRSRKLDFRKPEGNASAGPPLQRSLLRATFILHLLSDSLLLTWLLFYISSLNLHLHTVTEHPQTADLFSSLFGALQMLGLFTAPVVHLTLHKHWNRPKTDSGKVPQTRWVSRSSVRRLVVVYALRILVVAVFGVSCLVPSLGLQVLGFGFHVAVRSSMLLLTFSLYNAKFPKSHYGALLGIHTFVSSFLTLLQHPVFLLLTGPLRGDPFWIHATFLLLSLVAVSVPLALCVRKRRKRMFLRAPQSPKPRDTSAG